MPGGGAAGDGPEPAATGEVPEPIRGGEAYDPPTEPAAVAAIAATGLTAAADAVLDDYCRLVARLLRAPVALVALVDGERQLLPGVHGLGGQAQELRQTPITHAVCGTVMTTGRPLLVSDARLDPARHDGPVVTELGVVAYLGVPIVADDGIVLGALCAIDRKPRDWDDEELATVVDLARAVSSELRLRTANLRSAGLLATAAQASARMALVAEVSDVLTNVLDPVSGLSALAAAVVPGLADWAVVDAVVDDRVYRVEVVHRDRPIPPDVRRREMPPIESSATPLARVIRGLEPLVRHDDADLAALRATDALGRAEAALFADLGADHALVLGLQARGRVLGALTLVRTGPYGFSAEEEQTAGDVARRAALAVDNARLYALQRGAAATLQAGLLTKLPQLGEGEVAGRYLPASEAAEVGGDWYDAYLLPIAESGNLVIGDVVGHDLTAATQMGALRNLLRALAVDRVDLPGKLIARLDRVLAALGQEILATLVVGRVDRADDGTARFTWSNAGHPPPVLVLPDGSAHLLADDESDGPMLGADPVAVRGTAQVLLPVGSTLLLYTDGLVERRDTAIDVRLEELRATVGDHVGGSLDDLLDGVRTAMVGDKHDDDVALLAFRPT